MYTNEDMTGRSLMIAANNTVNDFGASFALCFDDTIHVSCPLLASSGQDEERERKDGDDRGERTDDADCA